MKLRISTPAPSTMVKGKWPATVATLVIKMGRKRANSEFTTDALLRWKPRIHAIRVQVATVETGKISLAIDTNLTFGPISPIFAK